MAARTTRSPAQDRLLDLLWRRFERWVRTTPLVSQASKATVTSVTAGAASDGTDLVVVNWRGANVAAPYLSGYTPAAGHVVAVIRTGSQLLIVGRIIGTP